MFLFILESIGTQELIIIGIIALIIFGPRKLPELARTIGRTMADFRKVTSEFKSTWEKEVAEDKEMLEKLAEDPLKEEKPFESVAKSETQQKLLTPAVKELTPEEIAKIFPNQETKTKEVVTEETQSETVTLSKRDWL